MLQAANLIISTSFALKATPDISGSFPDLPNVCSHRKRDTGSLALDCEGASNDCAR